MSLDKSYIERCFHELLQEVFLEAKEQGLDGQLDITISASGSLNSNQLKIETRVQLGSWQVGRGEMTALNLESALAIAKSRYYDNRVFQPKLLTVERPSVFLPMDLEPVDVEEDEIPF